MHADVAEVQRRAREEDGRLGEPVRVGAVRDAHARAAAVLELRTLEALAAKVLPHRAQHARRRDGGGVGLPGTGSPRKTLALER